MVAHELKEAYCKWFDWAKTKYDVVEVKKRLAFYRKVEETKLPAFLKAIQTFKNWQVEIFNSFSFDYPTASWKALIIKRK
ncbi:transposase [Lysinibacillus capsici]|nr:transposase [Lysinibacillus capsici]